MALIVQTIGVVGTLTAAAIAVRSYVNSNKRAEEARKRDLETRQAQLFMQIYLKYQDVIMDLGPLLRREWEDADDFVEKYMKTTPASDGVNLGNLMAYYEGVAVLLMKNMIDIDLVYELMPTNVTVLWSKYEGLVKEWRVKQNYPQLFRMVEWLSNRLVEYGKTRGDPLVMEYRVLVSTQ